MSSVQPKTEYVASFTNLSGGINLFDPEYALKANETPLMKNLIFENGMLRSRKGRATLGSFSFGHVYAAFERYWHGRIFVHAATYIYAVDPATGSAT